VLSFPREARLVRKSEYDAVYRAGKRRSSAHFTVFLRANTLAVSRFGFSIKKAVGGAVVPLLTGFAADHIGLGHALVVPALCYVWIGYFGMTAYRDSARLAALA